MGEIATETHPIMEGKCQTKLKRTSSSLIRSPSIQSSVHSLSSIDEESLKKSHKPISANTQIPAHFFPLLAAVLTFPFLLYFLRGEIDILGRFLLLPIFITLVAILAVRKGSFVRRASLISSCFLKHLWEECRGKSRFRKGDSVEWFIGGGDESPTKKALRKTVRQGVEFFGNGDFYEGEFYNGKSNGSGVYSYFVNGRYEGDWVDGRYDGHGIESWARGSRYRGQYRQGLRHGFGVYRFYTGDSYVGEWCNGQSHGIGVQTCSDGSTYVGEFKFAAKHGLGCYHFRNGDQYSGEYFGDKIHGYGVYRFANGHCYEGSWHEGRKQGFGMYTFRHGDTRCGEWDSGILKTPLTPTAVLQAVQSARKASENAIRLPRVDDQVSKAVKFANRAATAARIAAIKAVQLGIDIDGNACKTVVKRWEASLQ